MQERVSVGDDPCQEGGVLAHPGYVTRFLHHVGVTRLFDSLTARGRQVAVPVLKPVPITLGGAFFVAWLYKVYGCRRLVRQVAS